MDRFKKFCFFLLLFNLCLTCSNCGEFIFFTFFELFIRMDLDVEWEFDLSEFSIEECCWIWIYDWFRWIEEMFDEVSAYLLKGNFVGGPVDMLFICLSVRA